jgi:threonine/homoserine/homoserine lactone efflux protein
MEYTALILFVISTSITPGPNNLMIMASGVNFGFRKSLPHLLGVDIGFPLMLIAVGMGVNQVFEYVPSLMAWLKIVGALYLTYLAFKIATHPVRMSKEPDSQSIAKPFTFLQAALFQWVNPKAWIMAVGAVVTYVVADADYVTQVCLIALLFILFGAPCTVAWLSFGSSLKEMLSNPKRLKVFNIVMACLLMTSLLPVFIELFELFLN